MLVFLSQRLLGSTTNPACEDVGLSAIRQRFDERPESPQFAFIWLPVALALGNVEYLVQRIFSAGRIPYRLVHGVSPLVIALWTFFTFCSMLSLLQFGRAGVSFAFKFSHVFFELVNLLLFLSSWGWTSHALATLVLAFVGLYSALAMPCEVVYPLTSIGAVLDTANFLVVLFAYLRLRCATPPRRSDALFLVVLAFALHATYIWSFLFMAYVDMSDDWLIAFRTYGVYANCLAIHCGVGAVASYYIDDDAQAGRSVAHRPGQDTIVAHHDSRAQYRIGTEGTILPVDRWTSSLILCVCCISSGQIFVDARDPAHVVVYNPLYRRVCLRAARPAHVVTINSVSDRVIRSISWLLFLTILNAALYAEGVRVWLAFLVAWYLPSGIGAALAQLIIVNA